MQHVKTRLVLLGVLIATFFSQHANAQGDLLLNPRRIVFDGSKKTQEVNLANVGKDTNTFLVSLMEIRMQDDGTFQEIVQPDSNQNFASKYLRFFPRSVKLGPNEAQTVKIQLTKAGQLPPGEYRSHLYFRPLKNAAPLGDGTSRDTTNINVTIAPVIGLSIPVIIRVGAYDAGVSISDVSINKENETPTMSMVFNRTGNMSVYGDISVDHIAPDGKATPVGLIKGIAVYTPNAKRGLTIELDKKVKSMKGKLHIAYKPQPEDKIAKDRKSFAESDFQL